MKKIAFVNVKGGVGKSMCLWQIAGVLSDRGKNVLIIDADPQHNLTVACLGNEGRNVKYGLYELLIDECSLSDVLIQPFDNNNVLKNIYIIPSNYDLFMYEKDNSIKGQVFELSKKLEKLQNFDYILVDTNPSLSFILTPVLTFCQSVISVFDASLDSIDGFNYLKNKLIKEIQNTTNKNLSIDGIILNNHKIETGFSKDMIDIVDKTFPNLRLEPVIKGIYKNKDSRAFCEPMIIHDRKHLSTLQWIDLTTNFIRRVGV